eukprot:10493843-Ditylum_brightwellii.AAC.1
MYDKVFATLDFTYTQPFKILDDQDEVLSTLIKQNKLHLHHAFDTPFAEADMQQYIGENGTGKGNLGWTAAANSVNVKLTVEELKSLLKKQSKTTSSSLSGQHYGHYKAEAHEYISRLQFGNRKVRSALDALLLKITMMDSLYLFCLNGRLLNNDAVACYNHMIPALASLHLQSLGLPQQAAVCSVQVNKKVQHVVCTSAGELTEYYQHSKTYMKYDEG